MTEIARLNDGRFFCLLCAEQVEQDTNNYKPNLHYMTICHKCKRPVYVVAAEWYATLWKGLKDEMSMRT